jgi:hypothetical protein
MNRPAIAGAIVWVGLVAAARLTAIELLFLLAPLVAVPVGLELRARLAPEEELRIPRQLARWLQFSAALGAVVAFWFKPGPAAAALAFPWFCLGAVLGAIAVKDFLREGFSRLGAMCAILSSLYLSVGCAWLVASRLGMTPMGFQEPIVLLTAVHFHFAGFAAPILALAVGSAIRLRSGAANWIFRIVTTGVLAGPGLLAAGFVIGPRMKLAAALLVACSEAGLAFFFLTEVRTLRPLVAQALVGISASSAIAAMVLAAVWAIGEFPLQPFVHLDEMARFHGTANGLGFILCGLLGWTYAARDPASRTGGVS